MSTFAVNVVRIRAVEPIANADAIEVAVVGGYRCVVQKGTFPVGSVAAYIPEDTIVPELIIKRLGLEGRLAGPNHDRVRAIKLRGVLSQGLLYPVSVDEQDPSSYVIEWPTDGGQTVNTKRVSVGDDVATDLGCVKYIPVIPTNMAGDVVYAGPAHTIKFDIENIKKYPDVFQEGELVFVTEKLHGTFCGIGIVPETESDSAYLERRFVVFSKGLGGDGLVFSDTQMNRERNLYVRTAYQCGLLSAVEAFANYTDPTAPAFILGEIFGAGVQDLTYGTAKPEFRMFAAICGAEKQYIYSGHLKTIGNLINVDCVPFIAENEPLTEENLKQWTTGATTFNGVHMREGVVIVPALERHDPSLGRVVLKSINEQYLLRKNPNATEFQ